MSDKLLNLFDTCIGMWNFVEVGSGLRLVDERGGFLEVDDILGRETDDPRLFDLSVDVG